MKRGYVIAALLSGVMILFIAGAAAAGTTVINATVPLSVYDVVIDEITAAGATVQWQTNTAATSLVFYDTAHHEKTADYSYRSVPDFSGVTGHLQILTGLAADTVYYVRVASTAIVDEEETAMVSPEYAFTTLTESGPGGGGGGGGSITTSTTAATGGTGGLSGITIELTGLTAKEDFVVNALGQAQAACRITSADADCTIDILKNTYLRDASSKPLTELNAVILTDLPSPPDGETVITAYDFG
ncbi:MAG: hypothetical protein EHM12_12985, partial [Dehalococcoidia bacterium]